MKYASAPAFRDALEQRLRTQTRESGVSLMRLRKRVAFERFLARLVVAAPDRWVLKGAFALDVRLGLRTRATKDIDLARADDEQAATEDLVAAAAVDLGDFFVFEARRTPALDAGAGFHAVRYTVLCELAGRRFEQFPVDVALAETPVLPPEPMRMTDLLSFAEVAAPELPVVALEQYIAEKLHAYTGRYGTGERESTRSKDLVDLVLVADLARSTLRCYERRSSRSSPRAPASRCRRPSQRRHPPGPNRAPSWRKRSVSPRISARVMPKRAHFSTRFSRAARTDPGIPSTDAGADAGDWRASCIPGSVR